MIAVLLAGLWQWQAIRADDALERETKLAAAEPGRIQALEISELRREHARQTKELRAEHTRQTNELRAECAREIGELRAEHALKLKQMRVQQVYANGLPVRTSEMKFMLRKYFKGKLQSLMPPPRSPAEASERG